MRRRSNTAVADCREPVALYRVKRSLQLRPLTVFLPRFGSSHQAPAAAQMRLLLNGRRRPDWIRSQRLRGAGTPYRFDRYQRTAVELAWQSLSHARRWGE